ncbi:MAG: M48 family metalloprotease [Thermoplasmata archaeon]
MGLRTRMALAISALFALLYAIVMVVFALVNLTGIAFIIIGGLITLGILFLQYLVSPLIIKWIYKIDWMPIDALSYEVADYIRFVCRNEGINLPQFGIIPDDNPNAFCFGWTRNNSHLVITRGILKYCTPEEQIAVIGHELGHIRNNDFIVMTLVAAVPMMLYVIARGTLDTTRYVRRSGGRNNPAGAIVLVGLIAYLAYYVSQFIALLVSRYREYFADRFSAESTRNPNALSSAFIKIAYGLVYEGQAKAYSITNSGYAYDGGGFKESSKFQSNALMIFDVGNARALAANAAQMGWLGGRLYDKEMIKRAMAWDIWNPWSTFHEITSTHPRPAKRINELDKIAREFGQEPFIGFDLKQPESYVDDFLKNVFVKYAAVIAIPIYLVAMIFTLNIVLSLGLLLAIAGLCLTVYWAVFRYPMNFTNSTVRELLSDVKANPVEGRPVVLRGRVIGRGQPGLFWAEDLKLDDGTGIMYLDYQQIVRFIDLLFGLLSAGTYVGKEATIVGWYRRGAIPYLDIYKIILDQNREHTIYTRLIKIVGGLGMTLIGGILALIGLAFHSTFVAIL